MASRRAICDEPTFELGVWKDLEYDAVQRISYDGILACFEQGNQLLNGYNSDFVSVHDPDEYLSAATFKRLVNTDRSYWAIFYYTSRKILLN